MFISAFGLTLKLIGCDKVKDTEVLRLCQDIRIDSAFVNPSNRKALHILKKNYHFVISWKEKKFDFKNVFSIKMAGKATSLLPGYKPSPDAFFTVDAGPDKGLSHFVH